MQHYKTTRFFHVTLREQIYKLYLKKQKFKVDFYSKIKFVL